MLSRFNRPEIPGVLAPPFAPSSSASRSLFLFLSASRLLSFPPRSPLTFPRALTRSFPLYSAHGPSERRSRLRASSLLSCGQCKGGESGPRDRRGGPTKKRERSLNEDRAIRATSDQDGDERSYAHSRTAAHTGTDFAYVQRPDRGFICKGVVNGGRGHGVGNRPVVSFPPRFSFRPGRSVSALSSLLFERLSVSSSSVLRSVLIHVKSLRRCLLSSSRGRRARSRRG